MKLINFLKEKLRWIIFSILGIGVAFAAGSDFFPSLGANTVVTEIPERIITGYMAFNVFENTITGEHVIEPTTLEEHNAVRQKNAQLPQKIGHVWIQNGLTPQYAPAILVNNSYYKTRETDVSSTTLVRVKVQNKEGIVPITDIVNDQLTDTGLQKLQ